MQARFSTWLRTLNAPARFACWQMPATLDEKINRLSRLARETDDAERAVLLMEYRRHDQHVIAAAGVDEQVGLNLRQITEEAVNILRGDQPDSGVLDGL